jgi:NAD(P)-dependent dehydrogenase (short-subunit alcohol dehydrogenase family)
VIEASQRGLAVVVGATGAIGRAVVTRLRAEGFVVLGVGRTSATLESLADEIDGVETCVADITNDRCIAAISDAVDGRRVAAAVHSPTAPPGGDVLSVAPAVLATAVEVKVGGLLRLVRAVDAGLGDGSRIIALGGVLGYEPIQTAPASGVANAAQANLVRQLSTALGPRGITVHVVAPGPVATERLRSMAAADAERRGITVEEVLAERGAELPIGRLVTPEEIAWAVATLTAPEAAILTGGALVADGGRRKAMP